MPVMGSLSGKSLAAGLGIAGAMVCLVLWILPDYGMSWDEHFRSEGGKVKLAYYEQLLSGSEAKVPTDHYPGLFDMSHALLNRLIGNEHYQNGHYLSAFFGLMGVLGTGLLAKALGGARAGFLAALFLLVMPRYFGHLFFNPKDIPFAACYVWGVYTLVLFVQGLPRPSWPRVLAMGFAFGATMSTRLGGGVLFVYLGLLSFLFIALADPVNRGSKILLGGTVKSVVAGLFAFLVLAIFWPSMHGDPVASSTSTIATTTQFGFHGKVLFAGQSYLPTELPFYYIWAMLLFTLPEYILLLLVGGLLGGSYCLVTKIRQRMWTRICILQQLGLFAVLLAAMLPLLYAWLFDVVVYDGIRHVLFLLPLLACLAALAFEGCLRWLQEYKPLLRLPLFAVFGLLWLKTVFSLILLHPYEYIYYNSLVGGTDKTWGRFDNDYWGTSYREAVETLSGLLLLEGESEGKRYGIYSPHAPWLTETFYPTDLPFTFYSTVEREEIDFFVVLMRDNAEDILPGEVLCVVRRGNVPLCLVKDLRSKNRE